MDHITHEKQHAQHMTALLCGILYGAHIQN